MQFIRFLFVSASIFALASGSVWAQRDEISIVGSSTVYPFTTVVAERFGRSTDFSTPKVESTGTGGGMKQFCAGTGTDFPDLTNASRRILASELEDCRSNGVEVIELKIGYDGIVFISNNEGERMQLTRRDIFLALAARVPNDAGELVKNPHQTWQDVNPDLPAKEIEVLGPPPTSGTRDAFLELVMEPGAESIPALAEITELPTEAVSQYLTKEMGVKPADYNELVGGMIAPSGSDVFELLAFRLREDGRYIEAGENDNLIVQKVDANRHAVGIVGYSFLEQNQNMVQAHRIEGVAPNFDTIASGDYPVSRPLYVYIKKNHIGAIPGMKAFLDEFVSEAATGPYGYLSDRGLIPLRGEERQAMLEDLDKLETVQL